MRAGLGWEPGIFIGAGEAVPRVDSGRYPSCSGRTHRGVRLGFESITASCLVNVSTSSPIQSTALWVRLEARVLWHVQ